MRFSLALPLALLGLLSRSTTAVEDDFSNLNPAAVPLLRGQVQRDFDNLRAIICYECLRQCLDDESDSIVIATRGSAVRGT
jgi:hypothetical protein